MLFTNRLAKFKMPFSTISITTLKQSASYEIDIGGAILSNVGKQIRTILGENAKRVAVISNQKVLGLYGNAILKSLKRSGLQAPVWRMNDGERYKNIRSLEGALVFLGESGLTRSDAVLALGGGVVGDLAGFAASVYLRGIPFFQAPTTLLSMIDSSVGGKTGINTQFGKNLVGSFYSPRRVIVDVETLSTLPERELTAGFCEAVKQGAVAGGKLFNQTANFLADHRTKNQFSDSRSSSELIQLIYGQISFKAQIVRQDERESLDRQDAKSRKILNFGHTFGHALEKVTNYKYFRHGEAVGYGIIFAAELSKILELIDNNELKCLNDVVHRTGKLPSLQGIDRNAVMEAFRFDKKLISESLQWILLKGIGDPIILVKRALKRIIH
jgi:3-dehydroquinate synthase